MGEGMILAIITGGTAGFVAASFTSGGRHIFGTYALLLAGTIVGATPRRFLPDRFLWWYHDALDSWKP